MNTHLSHLPNVKQYELIQLTKTLSSFKEIEMVILFGSYARGNWVEDVNYEKAIIYEYKSDYDILVVLTHENLKHKFKIEDKVKTTLIKTGIVTTLVNMIFHGVKQLNQSLVMGNYFFKDIKKEGIILYDSEKFKLATPKKLTPAQSHDKAQEYFEQWFTSANRFLEHFEFDMSKEYWLDAAFHLHQATERYFTTILLVYTDYRPKDHNLENLDIKVTMCDKRFDVFPKETEEQKRLFELLKKAYIDARYKMNEYIITKSELKYLLNRVMELKKWTQEICAEKIKQISIEK